MHMNEPILTPFIALQPRKPDPPVSGEPGQLRHQVDRGHLLHVRVVHAVHLPRGHASHVPDAPVDQGPEPILRPR